MRLAAAAPSERFTADAVGDAHDPGRDSRTTLETRSASPDGPERVIGDFRYLFGASGNSPSKARNAAVIARMNLIKCGLIAGRNGGNERAILLVSGNHLQYGCAARSDPGACRRSSCVRGPQDLQARSRT